MTDTGPDTRRRNILAAMAVFLAGCTSQIPGDDTEQTSTATDTATPTETSTSEPGGWSVQFAYDGNWQGSVSVTTAEGDTHQAFADEGAKIVDIEAQLGVETQAVRDIVVTAQKRASDDRTLRVEIRRDGDVVAEGSTDASRGQVMVSHHGGPGGNGETTPTDTQTPTDTSTPTDTPTSESGGWSVRFAYDGNWQGSVSVTTDGGDTHQAFSGEGTKIVDVEAQMGVETQAVEEIVVTAQKRASDDRTLRVEIRSDGDVVAEGSTDAPRGQVMVSHDA